MRESTDQGQFITGTVPVTKVHGDLNQEVVRITVDRLNVILLKHANAIEERKSWVAPLGILVSIIITIVTAQFRHVLFSPDTWMAIYVIAGLLVFVWLAKTSWRAYNAIRIEDLVERIKSQKDNQA